MTMVVEEDLKNIQYSCHLSEEQDPTRTWREGGGSEKRGWDREYGDKR